MEETAKAISSITINAPVAKVWEALTKPELVKQWLFGANLETTWEIGSPITYSGEWEGKPFQDHGTVIDIQENKFIKTKYWSAAFGTEDKLENYVDVDYVLESDDQTTTLTITQAAKDEESRKHSEDNWNMVLVGFKKLLEQ